MKTIIKKALVFLLAAVMLTSVTMISASACASIYVGSALTEDGSSIVARSEDLGGSINKLFFYREAGTHKAGEVYHGCYGFTWTFTHDSYAYTAFPDDNGPGVGGICPDCGSTEENHTPYEEAGTNEKGLTVSATETLFPNQAMDAIDPLVDGGIAESEIPTVLLSECASAHEAVELLLGIYDTTGAQEANGLFIADWEEIWYVENLSGHHYIALLLPDDLVFLEMNISVIGAIDLDDTEHVIASEGLIETAVQAGTFVGNAEENIIDFRNSCSDAADYPGYGSRTINGLNYLTGTENYTEENTQDSDLVISNVDERGALVGLYTNIELPRQFTVEDVMDFYKVDPIGRPANQETHIFQIFPRSEEQEAADAAIAPPREQSVVECSTIEWVSMGNDRYTVFVPYLPMLITDTYEGYQVSTAPAEFASDEPDDGRAYYSDSDVIFSFDSDGSFEMLESAGWRVLPENWRDSYYWSFDAVAELITSGSVSEADEDLVLETYAELQKGFGVSLTGMRLAMYDLPLEELDWTSDSSIMAQYAHQTALSLYDTLTGGTSSAAASEEAPSGEAPSGEASR